MPNNPPSIVPKRTYSASERMVQGELHVAGHIAIGDILLKNGEFSDRVCKKCGETYPWEVFLSRVGRVTKLCQVCRDKQNGVKSELRSMAELRKRKVG